MEDGDLKLGLEVQLHWDSWKEDNSEQKWEANEHDLSMESDSSGGKIGSVWGENKAYFHDIVLFPLKKKKMCLDASRNYSLGIGPV